jgi:hypothetical protein
MHQLRRSWPLASSILIGLVVIAASQSWAVAQDYEELPLFQDNGKPVESWSKLSGTTLRDKTDGITQMLTGEATLVAADFDQYFNDIVFPLFAEWKPIKGASGKETSPIVEGINGVNPPNMRARFKREFAAKATNPGAHEHLNTITLAKMDQIAIGNYHPVVRANAVMMIAELSDSDPNGPPWKKAIPVLLKYVNSKDTIDAIRMPAWRGLVRQAQAGVDAATRAQIVNAAIQALAQRSTAAGGQDARDWTCRRAIDVLTAVNDPASNDAVFKAIMDTLKDSSTSLTIRAAAAESLAKIKFKPPANLNATALAKTLAKIAVEDYKHELEQDAQHSTMIVDRLKQHLGQIKLGLVGSDGNGGVHAMSAAADAQQYISSLIAPIDNLAAACNTPLLDPPAATTPYGSVSVVVPIDRQRNIAEAITNAGAALEAAVQRGEAAAPGAAPVGAAPAGAVPGKTQPEGSPLD